VFGKTESTEFAMYEPTRTRNPNDLGRTPGGSSSGWTSTEGVFLLAQSLDTLGIFSRRAADLGLLYRVLRAPGFSQAHRARPARAGAGAGTAAVLRAGGWGEADGDMHDALDEVARRLEASGWAVSELAMPDAWRGLPDVHTSLMAVEVASNMRAGLGGGWS